MELKERFEEASKKLPVQTCLDGKLEILYRGFKFVKEKDGGYDILDLKTGEHQLSVYNNDNLLRMFEREPFTYVCDIHFIASSSKKLLSMELNLPNKRNSDTLLRLKTVKTRVKKCVHSL